MAEATVVDGDREFPTVDGTLHKCSRCCKYFSSDELSTPCRYHSGEFITGSGTNTNGVMGYTAGFLPEWKCCGELQQTARGCQKADHHLPDVDFENAASVFRQFNRQAVAQDFPPPAPAPAPPPAPLLTSAPDGNPPSKEALEDWKPVTVTRDDTLVGLALRYGVDPGLLRRANRLPNDRLLLSRSSLLVPPQAWRPSAAPAPRASTVLERVMREGGVSREEARYYLDLAGGDPQVALDECREDKQWEAASSSPAAEISGAFNDGLDQPLLRPVGVGSTS